MVNKICKKCLKSIGKKIKLQCGRCECYFHLGCGGVSELDARLMQTNSTPWTCESCLSRRSSIYQESQRLTRSGSSGNSGDIYELKSLIGELRTELREIKTSMDFLNEKYEEERNRNQIISEMFSEISKDNQVLKAKVLKLENALSKQYANNIKNNLCISGLSGNVKDKKSAPVELIKLFTSLSVPVKEENLESVRLYDTPNGPKVSVTLVNADLKNNILKARAERGRISHRKLGLGESDQPIFIDEELTRETYHLFKKAKELKTRGYKYVWHRNCKVMVRRRDDDEVIVIKNETMLNDLCNSLENL